MPVPPSLKEYILNAAADLGLEGAADTVQRERHLSTDSNADVCLSDRCITRSKL